VILKLKEKLELQWGSHEVVIKTEGLSKGDTSINLGNNSSSRVKAGDTEVKIENKKLTVNGKNYGVLKHNDSILIEGQTVKINNKVVNPTVE
jgi:hypothetical protein